jgi:hypothetical protein
MYPPGRLRHQLQLPNRAQELIALVRAAGLRRGTDTRQAPAAAGDPGGYPDRRGPTIGEIASYPVLCHHSAVGLIDRGPSTRPGQRNPDADSESVVRVTLTAQPEKQLDALVEAHRHVSGRRFQSGRVGGGQTDAARAGKPAVGAGSWLASQGQ